MTGLRPEITDLRLAELFCDLVDLEICEEPCEYYSPDGSPACIDLLDSDTCNPCKARLAYAELESRRA